MANNGGTLREDDSQESPYTESAVCLNCSTPLKGQYCGECGQRSRSRLISLWQLLREAFGDLFELDSRLWRTLIPLLIKPGQLTRDYLRGRRARYMPPFRMYLVLSVLFFVVAFFNPQDDLSLLYEPAPQPTAEEIAANQLAAEEAAADRKEKFEAAQQELDKLAEAGEIPPEIAENFGGPGINIEFDDDSGIAVCKVSGADMDDIPQWLAIRLTPERLQRICTTIGADGGKTFADLLLDKIPVALIVLLPLMALALKILYPLSRRYFVEHLLFFVHFHAFFFAILILQILFMRATSLLPVTAAIPTLVVVAASFYIPVYLYLAMRRVYGQGRILTFIKFAVLLGTYFMGAALTLLGAAAFTVISI